MKEHLRNLFTNKKNWLWIILAVFSMTVISASLFFLVREEPNPVNASVSPESMSDTDTPRLELSDYTGKVLSAFSQTTPSLPAACGASLLIQDQEETGSAFENRVVVCANGYLNIRKEPNAQSAIIGKIYRGSAADIVEKGDGFTKIQSGTVEGWVSNEFILFGKEAESFALENGAFTATVLASSLNVRQEPDEDSTILATVEQNQVFIVDEQLDGWVKIFYTSSISGYLSSEYVKVEMNLGQAFSIEEENELLALYEEKESIRQSQEESSVSKDTAASSATKKPTSAPTEAPEETEGTNSEVSSDDLHLLAALCQAEAGYSYDSCLPVAILVMNRVRSSQYPDTVHDVIYQKNQFSPASSGRLNQILLVGPCQAALNAAADALAGAATIDGEAFSYLNFCAASSANTDSYASYKIIGGNCFYTR